MIDSDNTPRPTTRTLAVIDGGLNVKARVHPLPSTGKPKLLEQVRQAIRTRHYSYRTEKAYVFGKHLQTVKHQHEEDLTRGLGRVALPDAIDRKYPNAARSGDGNGCFLRQAITLTG